MTSEDQLSGWTGPSSTTEEQKQKRTERMVREAIAGHDPFNNCNLHIYAKGSYANQTNVRADSDVDIAVQCQEAIYHEEATPGCLGIKSSDDSYKGIWTPRKLRAELESALQNKFIGQVDRSGSTAIKINSSTARVDADVIPCFDYRYHWSPNAYEPGSRVFKKDNSWLDNFPDQQLSEGNFKEENTFGTYKGAVRILKRVENAMTEAEFHREVPSFFVECITFNCPNSLFIGTNWTGVISNLLIHIWENLQGHEPSEEQSRWLEVSKRKFLFNIDQPWNRKDGRDFAKAAWIYLGYGK
jgi:hypothetical protein